MNRIIIWLVTIAGLLPVAFLSIQCLMSHALIPRLQRQPLEPGALYTIGSIDIQIGSHTNKLRLSTHLWPAVVTAAGIVCVFVGTFFLLPGQPQQFYRNGFSKVERYVQGVISSRNNYASVILATPNDTHAILIARQGRKVLLSVSDKSDFRPKIRDFFASRGMAPTREFLSGEGGETGSMCHFEFDLTDDLEVTASLIQAIFTDLFRVDDTTGLEFTTTGF